MNKDYYEGLKGKDLHIVIGNKGYGKTLHAINSLVNDYNTLIEENEELQAKVTQLETNIAEAYKLLDDIDEYMLVEQHLKLVEAKKLLERGNSND